MTKYVFECVILAISELIHKALIAFQAFLDAPADLEGAFEIIPEGGIAFLPVRSEAFVKIVSQFIEKEFPGGFSPFIGAQEFLEEGSQIGKRREDGFAAVFGNMRMNARRGKTGAVRLGELNGFAGAFLIDPYDHHTGNTGSGGTFKHRVAVLIV